VTFGAREDPLDQVVGGRRAEDVGQLLGQLVARQRRQVDAPRARVALHLGEQRAQRVAAVQLVGAIRGDHEHALAAQAAPEVGHERAAGTVGPVQVLDISPEAAAGGGTVSAGDTRWILDADGARHIGRLPPDRRADPLAGRGRPLSGSLRSAAARYRRARWSPDAS
jgi:hypothetical protein